MDRFERKGDLPRIKLRKRQFVYVYGPLASGKTVFIEKMKEDNPGLTFLVIENPWPSWTETPRAYIERWLFDGAVIVDHVIERTPSSSQRADVIVYCPRQGEVRIVKGLCTCTEEPRTPSFCTCCGGIENAVTVRVKLIYDTGAQLMLVAFRWRTGWHCAPPCSDDQPIYATPEDAAKAHARIINPTARVVVKTERV